MVSGRGSSGPRARQGGIATRAPIIVPAVLLLASVASAGSNPNSSWSNISRVALDVEWTRVEVCSSSDAASPCGRLVGAMGSALLEAKRKAAEAGVCTPGAGVCSVEAQTSDVGPVRGQRAGVAWGRVETQAGRDCSASVTRS